MREEDHVEKTVPRLAPSRVRRASWGAIFAGMFFTIVLQVMFTLLGAAIGFATVNPMTQQNPAEGLGTGSAIWLLVTSLISVWIGACVAGRLSGGPRRADGMIHGIVTWSVATLAMLFLLATAAGALLGGAGALLGNALSAQAPTQGGANAVGALGEQVKGMFPQAGGLLPPTGRTEGQQVPGQLTELAQQDAELAGALGRMEANGGASKSPQERDQVINLLTTKHNLSQPDAANLVNQWDQQFQQARGQAEQKARQAGQTAAKGISQGALWGFIALVLGLLAAAWGGWAGTASLPRPTEAAALRT
jgi:hypothetical protein